MADIKSPAERSRNMAAVKSKGTKSEEYIAKLLYARGYRYRKNSNNVVGHPDIWLAKYNTAVFVNGCFWHRHNCKYAYVPKSNTDFWNRKFVANIYRDKAVKDTLQNENIKCLIIWECTIKSMKREPLIENSTIIRIEEFLKNDDLVLEL